MRLLTPLSLAIALAAPAAADHHMGGDMDGMPPKVMAVEPAAEAPGQEDASAVMAGTYQVDPGHTLVTFTVDHLGFSSYTGQFGNPSGSLNLDPENPESSTVEVRFPINAVSTTSQQLNEHLMSDDFFDAENHPYGTFRSTSLEVDGMDATIEGVLTLRGIDQPVTLDATFYGAGTNPMSGARTVGFRATTNVNRSDFNIDYALPVVSDRVNLVIDAAFEMGGGDSE